MGEAQLWCDRSQNDRLDLASWGSLLRDSNDTRLNGYSQKFGVFDVLYANIFMLRVTQKLWCYRDKENQL
jgi:hypothetical protein